MNGQCALLIWRQEKPGMSATAKHFERESARHRLAAISSARSNVLPWSVALALSAVVLGSTLAFVL